MKLTQIFHRFFNSEKTGGLVLILCTILSLLLANSPFKDSYINFWNTNINGHALTHWINDGLMAIFFLLIGLELEREVYIGELRNTRKALFPVIAAIGGVLIPAFIYTIFNYGTPLQKGAGIPMATDIAFAIGVLSLLGKRVPPALKIFITALAVIDDLCAILVIAVFYASGISGLYIGFASACFGIMILMNRLKIHRLLPYIILGIALWYCLLHSGVHATIAGVLTAFAIPFGDGSERSISYKLQNFLHRPVAYFIVPLFALANTALFIAPGVLEKLGSNEGLGIIIGLVAGKPLGIMLFTVLAVMLGFCRLPQELNWKHIFGVSLLAGIGFTMSIFVSLLAFEDLIEVETAKISIIVASLIAAILGLAVLKMILSSNKTQALDEES
jgi:NhaA family Na+:H+ antiporter